MRKVKIEVKHSITSHSSASYFKVLDDGEPMGSVFREYIPDEVDSAVKWQEIEFEKTAYLNGKGEISLLQDVLDPLSLHHFIGEQVDLIAVGYEDGRWKEKEDES